MGNLNANFVLFKICSLHNFETSPVVLVLHLVCMQVSSLYLEDIGIMDCCDHITLFGTI